MNVTYVITHLIQQIKWVNETDPWGKIKCDMCYKTFTSVIKLNDHRETVHWIKNQCDMFSKTFTSITQLNEHTKTIHGMENRCYVYSKIFASTKELNSHKNNHKKYYGKNLLVQAEYIPSNSQKVIVDILTICGYLNGVQ